MEIENGKWLQSLEQMRHHRGKALIFILAALVLSAAVSGCALAKPEYEDLNKGDRLCGVFVADTASMQELGRKKETERDIKLSDADVQAARNGEEILSGQDMDQKIEGTKQDNGVYSFESLRGEYLLWQTIKQENPQGGPDEIGSTSTSRGLYDVNVISNHTDEGDEESMEGTMGISSGFRGSLTMCSVYERPDKTIYLQLCGSSSMDLNGGSGALSKSVDERYSGIGEDRNGTFRKLNFTMNFQAVDLLKNAVLKEMDEDDNLINTRTLHPGKDEVKVRLLENTAYVIVEECLVDSGGKEYIKPAAYDCRRLVRGVDSYEAYHPLYYQTEDNIMQVTSFLFVR